MNAPPAMWFCVIATSLATMSNLPFALNGKKINIVSLMLCAAATGWCLALAVMMP